MKNNILLIIKLVKFWLKTYIKVFFINNIIINITKILIIIKIVISK